MQNPILGIMFLLSLCCVTPPEEESDALYAEPRTVERVARSLGISEAGASGEFNLQWRAAKACAWLARNDTDKAKKREYALKGMTFGQQAARSRPDRVEGYFFEAICVGALSKVDRTSKHLARMEELGKKSIEIDEKFDHGGPRRYVGLLYHGSSRMPFVGVGSMKEAEAHLRRACEIDSGYGYNQLALAKTLISRRNKTEARDRLRQVMECKAPPGEIADHAKWASEARDLLDGLNNTESGGQ